MVPLTSALYVHGTVGNATKVMVDIGTGFFVEKDIKGGTSCVSFVSGAFVFRLQPYLI
jgi:prefoldin subunit 5